MSFSKKERTEKNTHHGEKKTKKLELVRNNLLDRRGRQQALGPQRRLPGLRPDKHQRRQALDRQRRRDRLVGVHVDLHDFDFVSQLGRDGLELLGHQHAGAAPGREEVDDEGPVAGGDGRLEAVGVELLDLVLVELGGGGDGGERE